jgi:hypothetical protein
MILAPGTMLAKIVRASLAFIAAITISEGEPVCILKRIFQ